MAPNLHVLTVGLEETFDMAYGTLLLGYECGLIRVLDYGELCAIPTDEKCQVAVLGESLSKERLIDTAQLIRGRWPYATILVISASPVDIDDVLYDDRILPGYRQRALVAQVLRLYAGCRRKDATPGKVWEC